MTDRFVPEGRFLTLPGRGETFVRVHQAHSEAPKLLLLHGWTASADLNWFAAYRTLASRTSFVAIDHRGHGRGLRSERPFALEAAADDAAAALEILGTGPVIAVGFSMGGPIALHLARRHPHLVDGLVLASTTLAFGTTRLSRLQWAALPLIGAALRWDAGIYAVEKILTEVGARDEEVARWRDHLVGESKRSSPVDVIAAGRSLRQWDARPWAADLGLPAAAVVTVHDRLVEPRRQRQMAADLGALVVEVAGDHDVFLRDGPAFAAAVLAGAEGVAARLRPGATRPDRYEALVGAGANGSGNGHRRAGRIGTRLVARLRRRPAPASS
jgi:pimeloyl-ACP methyl ester carboxylesterase